MPRPSKEKRVCRLPLCDRFQAAYCRCPNHRIQMSVEEYETIRLIDYMGLTQEECAAAMTWEGRQFRLCILMHVKSSRVFW